MPDTVAGILTIDNEYSALSEKLIQCQEHCANISHLCHATYSDKRKAEMWLKCSELFKNMQVTIRDMKTGKVQ